jgi:fluoroquinolone transport system permease protein
MKAIKVCTFQMFKQISSDMMLLMACFVPIIVGFLTKYLVPFGENRLMLSNGAEVLTPYYPLFDVFLGSVAPIMLCFATTMILLEEVDDKVSRTYSVSPLGKKGYLFVRLVIPTIISFLANILVMVLFSISGWSFGKLLVIAGLGSIQALIISMMIIVFSKNKLEGMAVTKMTALTLLGIPAPYFLTGALGYLPGFLPSFWIGKVTQTTSAFPVLIALAVSALWIVFLYKRFMQKLAG